MAYYGKTAEWTKEQSEYLKEIGHNPKSSQQLAEEVADNPLFDNKNRCKNKVDAIKQHIDLQRKK